MRETIKKREQYEEFYTEERCYIVEIFNTPADPEVSIAQARVKPGVTTRWHRLRNTTERYYILAGQGSVEIGELPPQEVKAGDFVYIPPSCPQRITNIGEVDLIFLALCTPRFIPENYEDLEES